MTIFNTARLPQCTIGGVKVFYKESTVSGGRKTVTHEYPDTNTRYVEDLGKLEKTYNIEAVVNTNVSFSDRDKLLTVLEKGGLVTIIHPAFNKKQVVLKNYSLVDSTVSLGICSFSLSFEEASLNKLPSTVKGNAGFLDKLKAGVLDGSSNFFGVTWKDVTDAKESFDSAVATLSNTANEMQRTAQLVQGSTDTFSDFTTAINEVIDGARALVQTPAVLASKIKASMNNLSIAYNSAGDLFVVLENFFGFNGADSTVTGSSSLQKQIASNQNAIQNIFQAQSLALAYNAGANIAYKTLDELSAVITSLENGFDLLPSTVDRDTYKLLLQMRIEAMNIFNKLAIGLPKVTDYTTNKVPLNILVYSLYGSLDNKNTIKELNSFKDTSSISGTIKILSNG